MFCYQGKQNASSTITETQVTERLKSFVLFWLKDHWVTGDPNILTGFISSPIKDSVPELFLNNLGGFYLLMPTKKNQWCKHTK